MAHFYDVKRFDYSHVWIVPKSSSLLCVFVCQCDCHCHFMFNREWTQAQVYMAIDCATDCVRLEIKVLLSVCIFVYVSFALSFKSHASLKRFPFKAEVLRFSRNRTLIVSFSSFYRCRLIWLKPKGTKQKRKRRRSEKSKKVWPSHLSCRS